jgi:hypothetical protein
MELQQVNAANVSQLSLLLEAKNIKQLFVSSTGNV